MMETHAGLGLCNRCGQQKIQAGDKVMCFNCSENSTAPAADTRDPGEAELAQLLAKAGVRMPVGNNANGTAVIPPAKPVNVPAHTIPQTVAPVISAPILSVDFESRVRQALDIMEHLPMPKDMKQVKSVYKIIDGLKKILGV